MRLMKERRYYYQNNPEELEEVRENTLKMKTNFRTNIDIKKETKLIENYLTMVDLNNKLKSDNYDTLVQFKENFDLGKNSKKFYDNNKYQTFENQNKSILTNSNQNKIYDNNNQRKSILKNSGDYNETNNNSQGQNYEDYENNQNVSNYEDEQNYNNYQNTQNYKNDLYNNSQNFKKSYINNNTINKYTNESKKKKFNTKKNSVILKNLEFYDEYSGLNDIQRLTQKKLKEEKQEKKRFIKSTHIFFGIKIEEPYKNLDNKRKLNFKKYNQNQKCEDLYYLNPITLKKEIFKQNENIRDKIVLPNWHDYQRSNTFKINLYLFFGVKPDRKFYKKKQIGNLNEINSINQIYGSSLYLNTYSFPL